MPLSRRFATCRNSVDSVPQISVRIHIPKTQRNISKTQHFGYWGAQMSCRNILEKCRNISATQTRHDIFWQKNEISTYRLFQLRGRPEPRRVEARGRPEPRRAGARGRPEPETGLNLGAPEPEPGQNLSSRSRGRLEPRHVGARGRPELQRAGVGPHGHGPGEALKSRPGKAQTKTTIRQSGKT